MNKTMRRVVVALLAACGMILGPIAIPSEAATAYRSNACYVTDGIHSGSVAFKITSWRNADGTRTWHWSGQSRTVTFPAPTVTMTFRMAMNGRTGTTYSGTEGYWTGADGYITWTGYWWRYLTGATRQSNQCSARV